MRVLLTGGFGYLASRMADVLTGSGHEVILSGRRVPAAASEWAARFAFRGADVLDPRTYDGLMNDVEVVVHLASLDEREAEATPARAVEVSGEGTRLLLAAAREAHVKRVIFFSTLHVYGPSAPRTITEDTPVRAAHPYAIAHLTGEGFCREALAKGQDVFILRPSNGYGAPTWRDVDRWTLAHNDFCKQALEQRRIVLRTPGLQHRDFVAIDDVAQATNLVLRAPRSAFVDPVLNVGGKLSLSIFDIAERVQRRVRARLGFDCPIERPEPPRDHVSIPVDYRVDRLATLGYEPTDQIDDETDRLIELLSPPHR